MVLSFHFNFLLQYLHEAWPTTLCFAKWFHTEDCSLDEEASIFSTNSSFATNAYILTDIEYRFWYSNSLEHSNYSSIWTFVSPLECLNHVLDMHPELGGVDLVTKLSNIASYFQGAGNDKSDLRDCLKYLRDLSPADRSFYDQICIVAKLIIIMPATNAVSEQSSRQCVALRRTSGSPCDKQDWTSVWLAVTVIYDLQKENAFWEHSSSPGNTWPLAERSSMDWHFRSAKEYWPLLWTVLQCMVLLHGSADKPPFLPASQSYKTVHGHCVESCTMEALTAVAITIFRGIWNQCVTYIKFM